MSSGISFSGLSSGLDTNAIVSALMRLERAPITRIESDKARLQSKQGVVQELNGLLKALKDKAAALYANDALSGKTASSSDATVATATATAAAPKGSYNVTVTALASAHTLASVSSPTLVAGTALDITVGGEMVNVSVESGDTLADLAARINNTDGVGASASVINDKLVLISKTSGGGGTITVGGTAAATLGFSQTQAGADAAATINGLSVTASGNTIEGAVNGVTLELKAAGSTTITVGDDNAGVGDEVQAFVDAYNALISNINAATKYDVATKTAGTLQGDQTVTGLGGLLRGIAGSVVGGLSGSAYDSLAQIGITTKTDGTLVFDKSTFEKAFAADPTTVRRVFGYDDGSAAIDSTDGIARQIADFADTFSRDTMSSRLTGFTDALKRMDDKIATLEELMTLKETRMRQQFAAMETALARFQQQSAGLSAALLQLV